MRFKFNKHKHNKQSERLLNKKHHLRVTINKTFTKFEKFSKIKFKSDILKSHPNVNEDNLEEIENIIRSTRIWQNIDQESDEGLLKEQIWIGENFPNKNELISELKPLYNELCHLENQFFEENNIHKSSTFDIGKVEGETIVFILTQEIKKDMFFG